MYIGSGLLLLILLIARVAVLVWPRRRRGRWSRGWSRSRHAASPPSRRRLGRRSAAERADGGTRVGPARLAHLLETNASGNTLANLLNRILGLLG
jgi:hypothetical protein